MTHARTIAALLLGLLALAAAAPVAQADPATSPGDDAHSDCPVVAVLTYDPYVSVQPECASVPPGP